MEREVSAAVGSGEPEEVMSSAFKLKVTREDIQTLRNLCWLNDEVKPAAHQDTLIQHSLRITPSPRTQVFSQLLDDLHCRA